MRNWVGSLGMGLLLLGCQRDTPTPFRNDNLGIQGVFPREAATINYQEESPFGAPMEWWDTSTRSGMRLDESFIIKVGNLPPGRQGGTTPADVLHTFKEFLRTRKGKDRFVDLGELPQDRGPGFKYKATLANGSISQGFVVCRNARLYWAETSTPREDDPRSRRFLDELKIVPEGSVR